MAKVLALIPIVRVKEVSFDDCAKCLTKVCIEHNVTCTLVPRIHKGYLCYAIATLKALQAFKERKNVAKKIELEILLRIYADRQISRVLVRARSDFSTLGRAIIIMLSDDEKNISDILGNISSCWLEIDTKSINDMLEHIDRFGISNIALTDITFKV